MRSGSFARKKNSGNRNLALPAPPSEGAGTLLGWLRAASPANVTCALAVSLKVRYFLRRGLRLCASSAAAPSGQPFVRSLKKVRRQWPMGGCQGERLVGHISWR